MKKTFWHTIIFLLLSSPILGQNFFGPEYKFSEDILSKRLTSRNNSEIAWYLSYIGEYEKMLASWDKDEPKLQSLTPEQEKAFEKYMPTNAIDYIVQRGKSEQIIILNEAHQQPYHRIFTTTLLQGLFDQGFRYFGAETISEADSSLNKRKYPTLNTGYYTQEPCYGNLIREALRIGYKVFTYETTRFRDDSAGVNLREVDQARNIKKHLEEDPNAKILIHCGFAHIVESPYFSWGKAMAVRLIEYTGINPFTLDQVKLTEHSSSQFENPYFKITSLDYYAIFLDSSGNTFNGPPGNKEYDARVYHPRTTWTNGRPHWMFQNDRKPYFIDNIIVSYPCLVFAYLDGEDINVEKESPLPIPFDIIELKNKSDKKALSLKKGKYKIIIKDKKGQLQKIDLTI